MTDNPRDEVTLTKSSVGVSGSASDEACVYPAALAAKLRRLHGSKIPPSSGTVEDLIECLDWCAVVLDLDSAPRVSNAPAGAEGELLSGGFSDGSAGRSVEVGADKTGDAHESPAPDRALSYEELEVRLVGLSADVSRLTAERDMWRDDFHASNARAGEELDRVREAASGWALAAEAAEARVAVLREALAEYEKAVQQALKVAPSHWQRYRDPFELGPAMQDARQMGREALARPSQFEGALPSGSGVVGVGEAGS